MGRQLSVILWVIGIHLLISTGYGSIAPQTGSCSGEFKDAVPEIHSLSDSSALGSSVMVDLAVDVGDKDGVELPEFNQHVGLLVEARYGGVIVPCGIWSSPWTVTDSEVPDLESGRQRGSTTGAGTSSQVIDLESGRQRFSSGAPDIAPYGIWSSPWACTDSEVPDLASGRQWWSRGALDAVPYRRLRWSTPGASTSSQVIDLESRRERARRLNQRFIKLGFAILLGSTYAITSISVGDELSSRNRFISNCVLVLNIVSFVSLTAANMTLPVVT